MSSFIPFHKPSIGQEEIDEVIATLKSGWLTTGPRTAQFQEEFQEYVQAPHALAVNSCTAGLHLALAALGLKEGDEVITTPLTFCATVNTIMHVGATPVLADIGDDYNIDPRSIEARITPRTRAILPVHYAGYSCDMRKIWALAKKHNLYVVEDAAHAVGSHYKGVPIGAADPETGMRSDAVSYSFYATKNLTTGEGGMVTTHDPELAVRMKQLCLHGISQDAWNRYTDKGNWYYEVLSPGFKYNLSDLQSAIGIHQLRKLESAIEIRAKYAAAYDAAFAGMDELILPPAVAAETGRHAWHLYPLRLDLSKLTIDRDEFIRQLRAHDIGCSVHFIPIPLHPFFKELSGRPENHCPRALDLFKGLVSLPLYPAMTEAEVSRVAATVKQIVHEAQVTKALAAAHAS